MKKINYQDYPILQKLESKLLSTIPVNKNDLSFFDEHMPVFLKKWKENANMFSTNINYANNDFCKFSIVDNNKITLLLVDILKESICGLSFSGVWVCGDYIYMANIDIVEDNDLINPCMYVFLKTGQPLSCWIHDKETDTEIKWLSRTIDQDYNEFIKNSFAFICHLEMTKKFNQVNHQLIKAKSDNNKTNFDINYYSISL